MTPVLTGLVGVKDAITVATAFFFLSRIPRIYLLREYIRWDIIKNQAAEIEQMKRWQAEWGYSRGDNSVDDSKEHNSH